MISYSEIGTSGPTEALDEKGVFTATRKLKVAYAKRYKLATTLLGTIYPYAPLTLATARSFSFAPLPAELSTDATEEVSVSGSTFTVSAPLAAYQFAVVIVKYSNKVDTKDKDPGSGKDGPTFEVLGKENLFTEELSPTIEMKTLPGTGVVKVKDEFSNTLDPLVSTSTIERVTDAGSIENSILIPGATYTLTWYRMKILPASVLKFLGTINSKPFVTKTLGLTFDAQTLLYQPSSIRVDNKGLFTIPLRFLYKPAPKLGINQGWNYFWQASTQTYEARYTVLNGTITQIKPYQVVDYDSFRAFENQQVAIGPLPA